MVRLCLPPVNTKLRTCRSVGKYLVLKVLYFNQIAV